MTRTVTLQGNSLELVGSELKVGDTAPDAKLRKDLGTDYLLSEIKGKARVFSVVPSLDTPVCAAQTRRFTEEASNLGNILWLTISCDLPVAMSRFCGAEGIDIEKIHVLSDHKYLDFGHNYGTLIPEVRILCRAVFVVDATDTIRHTEYVPEITDHPDYDAVLASVKSL